MSTEETVITIAMTIAGRNGYPTSAWRLFESDAKTTLANMSHHRSPSLQPDMAGEKDAASAAEQLREIWHDQV